MKVVAPYKGHGSWRVQPDASGLLQTISSLLRWSLLLLPWSLAGVVTTMAAESPELDGTAYAVTACWAVDGNGGWDYRTLGQHRHRLYVAHGDQVDVIDVDSEKSAGRISRTAGVHGVGLAQNLQRGFTSNGRSNSVTAFDLTSMRPLQEVKVSGLNPDAIYYDEPAERVFTLNGKSENATVLDGRTLKIVGSIALAGKPEFIATDDQGHVYVNIEAEPGKLQVIDLHSLVVVATWELPGCVNPSGLAIDATHRRLFSACENGRMVVTNADTGRQVASAEIGADPDAVAIDSALELGLVSNGASGTLSVVRLLDADHVRLLAHVHTQVSARTMALDPATHRIYLAAATYDSGPVAAADQPPRIVANSFGILVAEPRPPALTPATQAPASRLTQ